MASMTQTPVNSAQSPFVLDPASTIDKTPYTPVDPTKKYQNGADIGGVPLTDQTSNPVNTPTDPTVTIPNSGNGTPTASSYTPSTYTATPYSVDPNATVASQIDKIISSGSPLMQQAEARARESMNARGMMNSSMAVSAAQSGLMDRALPIATQDSQSLVQAGFNTSTAKNQADQFGSTAKNTAAQTQVTQQNALEQTRMNNMSAIQIQTLQNKGNLENIYAQGVVNKELTALTNNNKLLLQNSANASQLYAKQLEYMAAISGNKDLDETQKAQALRNSVAALQDALDIMTTISGLPAVTSTLTFDMPAPPVPVPPPTPPPPTSPNPDTGSI
jgi:hypothetical protein